MYNEKVLQLFSNPKNAGMLKGANGVGEAGKVEDGAFIKLYVLIEDDIIINARFKAFGGVAAIVAGSMATQLIKGKSVDEALTIKVEDINKTLELPESMLYSCEIAQQSIVSAIKEYYKRKEKENK